MNTRVQRVPVAVSVQIIVPSPLRARRANRDPTRRWTLARAALPSDRCADAHRLRALVHERGGQQSARCLAAYTIGGLPRTIGPAARSGGRLLGTARVRPGTGDARGRRAGDLRACRETRTGGLGGSDGPRA